MVYGIAFCPVSRNQDLKDLGVDDSKALTEAQREGLLQKLLDNNDYIGWAINILSPRHISTRFSFSQKHNFLFSSPVKHEKKLSWTCIQNLQI
jgi:ribonuclease H2 subunit A